MYTTPLTSVITLIPDAIVVVVTPDPPPDALDVEVGTVDPSIVPSESVYITPSIAVDKLVPGPSEVVV